MKSTTVSVAEGKRGFSRLVREAFEKKKEIIVTKRGKPLAVIIPYDAYQMSRRLDGYRKILAARDLFADTGIKAADVHTESRKQLEERP
jgi:prevent-host-death family protein